MKKVLFSILALGLLAGCSSNNAVSESTQNKKQDPPKQAEQKKVENPKKDQNGNVILDQVGQVAKSDQATAELIKIKQVNQVLNVAPIKVTITDLKVIKLTNLSDIMKKSIETLYNQPEVKEPVYYLQLRYTAENTSDKNIAWNGIHRVITDKGEQLNPNLNLLSSKFDHEFFGKVTQQDQFGLMLSPDKWDIKNAKLIFNESADDSTYQTITAQQQVEYSF